MRKLNVKFLLYLLGGIVVFSGSAALAHHLQIKRIPLALLRQGQRAEDESDLPRACRYLNNYLEFQPDDGAQRAHLARLLTDKKLRAYPGGNETARYALERALSYDGLAENDRRDLRRLLVPIDIQLRRFDAAAEQLRKLPPDGDTASLWGQWYEVRLKTDDAILSYDKAVGLAPHAIDNYVRLARLLEQRRSGSASEIEARKQRAADILQADAAMNRLIANNPDSWQARVARWEFRRDFILPQAIPDTSAPFLKAILDLQLQAATADVRTALEKGPGQPEVRMAAAEAAQRQGKLDDARAHLDKALQLHHQDARLYNALASLERRHEALATTAAERKAARNRAIAWLRRGVEQLAPPAQADAMWYHATLLIDTAGPEELAEAEKVIRKLELGNFNRAGIDFLRGRVLFARQQWAEAARLLERGRTGLESEAALVEQVDTMLGRCYRELDEYGQMLAVYTRMERRNPGSLDARIGIAAAERGLGNVGKYRAALARLKGMAGAPASVWTEEVRLMIAEARRSGAKAQWDAVEEALTTVAGKSTDAVELAILRAEFLLARGEPDKARATLEQARAKAKNSRRAVELWTALVALAEHVRNPKEALRLLDEAERRFKEPADQVELRLARARYWIERRNKQTAAELKKLEGGLESFPPDQRDRLLNGLAESNYRAGAYKEAGRLWKTLAGQEKYQRDLRLRLVLFDLALQEGQVQETARVLAEIRNLEGKNGTFGNHAAALRLIWEVEQNRVEGSKKDETLTQALRLLDRVRQARPAWSAPLRARAEVEKLRGNQNARFANLEEAKKLGDRDPIILRQMVDALRRQGKDKEARTLVQGLSAADLEQPGIRRVVANTAARGGDRARAVEMALATVRSDSRDYRDHVWLGELLGKVARNPEEAAQAEEHLRRALELEDREAEPWLALVTFLAARDRQLEAEGLITRARARVKPEQRPLLLAQCFARLNNVKEASAHYEEALKAQPNDGALLIDYANFHLLSTRMADAEPLLRRMLDGKLKLTDEQAEWGHTRLALLLAYDKSVHRFQEALRHVGLRMEANGALVKDTRLVSGKGVEYQRCAARVLSTQPQWRCRDEAIKRFEALESSSDINADDRYILAHLYEAKNDWPKTREQLNALALAEDRQLQHLTAFTQILLRNGDKDEARRMIDKVEKLHKAHPTLASEVALAELQARWFEANREGDKAIALLKERVERKDTDVKEVLLLIASLGRQQRFGDALELLDRIWKCPAEMAGGTSVALLRAAQSSGGRDTERQRKRVAALLAEAIQKEPKNANLRIQLGDLHDMENEFVKAEKCYEDALELDRNSLLALNNLAWLLAQRPTGKAQKALELVNRAIALYGPRGELLDTRAVVYLALGRAEEARADLQEAVKEALTPVRCFHLARANLERDKKAAARELRRATELGLKPDHLHPAEQALYPRIIEELKRQ